MPNAIDYATSGQRPGRGGQFKPLVQTGKVRSLFSLVAGGDGPLWLEAIATALDGGAALLFSPTSDGGAFSVTLLDGDERSRSYCATGDEINACLQAVLSHFEPASASSGVPARTSNPRSKRPVAQKQG
jgi:hypothetical protein